MHASRFVVALIVAGLVFAGVGALLFASGDPDTLSREAGSGLLQLGMVGVGGAIIGLFIERQRDKARGYEERQRYEARAYEQSQRDAARVAEEDRERRLDLLARIRAAHVRVAYAQRLINAHDTPKTYFERTRDLMFVRYELEEISTEIEVGRQLFKDPGSIRHGIDRMIDFLDSLAEEYQNSKVNVDRNYARHDKSLSEAIDDLGLTFVDDFRNSRGTRPQPQAPSRRRASFEDYERGLTAAKGAIRKQVLSPDRT